MEGLLPVILVLAAMVAVLYLSYLFSRYLAVGASKINKSKYIKVIDRVVLGQDRMILIATIGEKYYLIGSTAQSIQILAELDDKDITEAPQEKFAANAAFKNTLMGLLSKNRGDINE